MRNEIGSHFEYDNILKFNIKSSSFFNFVDFEDYIFTFSGRSAIELIMKDILKERRIKTIYMPSYCCQSMIDPLEELNFKVEYYDVFLNEENILDYSIDENIECDIFFLMTYFGLGSSKIDDTVLKFKENGSVIIEDITHRMFNDEYHSIHVDYLIGSIRKWLPIMSGGFAAKKNGKLNLKPSKTSTVNIQTIKQAMKLKKKYINGENINKQSFIDLYSEGANVFVELNYTYHIDHESKDIINHFNFKEMINQRRRNAKELYLGLNDLEDIEFLSNYLLLNKSTPIFVPIILSNRNRDSLRKYLIKQNVYCPIHWPIFSKNNSDIPKYILSLICDQRYSFDQMKRIINIVRYWYFNIKE